MPRHQRSLAAFAAALFTGAVLAISATPAEAQEGDPLFHAGLAGASGGFAGLENTYGGGFGVVVGGRMPYTSFLALRGDGEAILFPMNHEGAQQDVGLPPGNYRGGMLTQLSIQGGGEALLPLGPVEPYVRVGLGFINAAIGTLTREEGGESPGAEIGNSIAYSFGGGVRATVLQGITAFIDAGRVTSFGGDEYGAVRIGIGL